MDNQTLANSTDINTNILTSTPRSRGAPQTFSNVDLMKNLGVPISALIGVVLNCGTIVLMLRPNIRSSVMSTYFSALASVDVTFLMGMFLQYSNYILPTGYDFMNSHRVWCKVLSFIQPACYAASSWVVAMVSIERSLVVMFPLKAATYSNKRRARIAIGVLIVAVGLLSSEALIIVDMYSRGSRQRCTSLPQFEWYFKHVRYLLMGVTTAYLPFLILITCNCMLVWKMIVAKRNQKSMTLNVKGYNVSKFTFTAVMVCLGFSLFSLPHMVILLVSSLQYWYADMTLARKFARNLSPLMAVTRSSVNFFIYVCSSDTFRKELVAMICGKCREGNRKKSQTGNKGKTGNFKS